jgi:hypothetical protein
MEGATVAKLPDDLQPVDEAAVKRLAGICGDSSASARTLKRYEEMKADGLNPAIGYSPKHNVFIVCDIGRC